MRLWCIHYAIISYTYYQFTNFFLIYEENVNIMRHLMKYIYIFLFIKGIRQSRYYSMVRTENGTYTAGHVEEKYEHLIGFLSHILYLCTWTIIICYTRNRCT